MQLDQMMQPTPEQQQAAEEVKQVNKAKAIAEVKVLESTAMKYMAEAQQNAVETQLMPQETQAKIISGLSQNIRGENTNGEFERRAKIAELSLKEEDIRSNERIASLQMLQKQSKSA
jgi:hypothetical protein